MEDNIVAEKSIMPKLDSTLIHIWNNVNVLDYLSGILLPMMFVFWYATTYLSHTFTDDPFEVSMFTLIEKII